jgi:hypothetical protein
MNVLGIKRGVVFGLVAMDPVEHWVTLDDFESQVIEQRATEFWNAVVNDIAPDWDGSESTYEAVREMHPDIDGTEVEIDGIHSLVVAQLSFDQAEAELRKQKSEVMAMMGKAQHAVTEYEGKTYKVASRQARGGGRPFLVIHKGKK